ncbi:class I SAM-dependent RNA methyltransferase [Kiritimatiellota bacterium B12222]|nr:class I SAM-dependent RNA methyltransferase [Kiritimatiellota bacterium B12222]
MGFFLFVVDCRVEAWQIARVKETVTLTCAKGVAPILAAEVKALGMEIASEDVAAVLVKADLQEQMRLCLRLRTAHRILVPLITCLARSPKELFRRIADFAWEDHLGPDGYVRIHGYVNNEEIRDQRFAFLTVKDAVMDRLRDKYGRRPDSGPSDHGASIYLHWNYEEVTISLDLAGRPLSKRGYRSRAGDAPLQEALAAALLLAGGWPKDVPLCNPMGGSGTIAIEAAWLAQNRAPGLLRDHFGLFSLKRFNQTLWEKEVEAAKAELVPEWEVPVIFCSDKDPTVIEVAKLNARDAGVEHLINFEVCDFRESTVPEESSWVVMNPPYGLRLEEDDLTGLYHEIGLWLKSLDREGQGLVFTGNLPLAKRFGLKLAQKHMLYNGPLECRLLGFELRKPGAKA